MTFQEEELMLIIGQEKEGGILKKKSRQLKPDL